METEGKIRILVADDNDTLREAVVSMLSDEPDFEVVAEAADALQAEAMGRATKPDVAILDVHMPEGGGWEAAKLLLAINPDIRMVAYTSFDRGTVPHTIKAAGVHAYVVKGGDPQILFDAVRGENVTAAPHVGSKLHDKMTEKSGSE